MENGGVIEGELYPETGAPDRAATSSTCAITMAFMTA